MNRFEALHALGLDDSADEQDVRLAYYGLAKAKQTQDFEGEEKLQPRVEGFVAHAKECRDFLLVNGIHARKTDSVASAVASRVFKRKESKEKLSITSEEDSRARLMGLQNLRIFLLRYRDGEASKRNLSIVTLLVCIILSFLVLRYLRVMSVRIMVTTILTGIAIAGSIVLTASFKQCKVARAHILDIDERIAKLEAKLNPESTSIVPADADAAQPAEGDESDESLDDVDLDDDVEYDDDEVEYEVDDAR